MLGICYERHVHTDMSTSLIMGFSIPAILWLNL